MISRDTSKLSAAGKPSGVAAETELQHRRLQPDEMACPQKVDQNVHSGEQHLRKVLNSLAAFVAVLTPEGIVTEVNLAAIKAAGVEFEDVLGKPFENTFWWSHSRKEQTRLRAAIDKAARGEISRYDAPARIANDNQMIVDLTIAPMFDEQGAVTHLVPSAIDVTEKRQAEEALRASEQSLSLAMQAAGLGTWDADMRSGKSLWSKEHFQLLGYEPPGSGAGEATVEMWHSRVHPDDAQRVDEAMDAARLDGSPFKPEYRIIRADNGRVVWLSVNGRFLLEDGGMSRFVGVMQDITELRRSQDLARQQEDDLAHLARLLTVDEMAAGLAHELNQPLGAILNYGAACAGILGSQPDTKVNKDALELLRDLDLQATRAGDIIKRLRSFVGKGPCNRAPAEVPDLVQYAVNLMASKIRLRSVSLELDIPRALPKVMVDLVQIGQVLVNLIRNGIEAMASSEPALPKIVVSAVLEKNAAVRISVADSGTGIAPELEKHIFESYFTTKSSGLGVGLTISRSIVESHGGRLEYAGNPGGGAIFQFTLPCAGDNSNQEPDVER